MVAIENHNISFDNNKFKAVCVCGFTNFYTTKDKALNMLKKGSCRNCKKDYRLIDKNVNIYKNQEDKWCKKCSGCGKEQAYTRLDHAKQSYVSNWQCKQCNAYKKSYNKNTSVGNEQRIFNKFENSAKNRQIEFNLSLQEMFSIYNGKCNLTDWDLSLSYKDCNASLDRIDSSKGYSLDNIQWVHSMVNMSKNKYNQEDFLKMCKAVADKVKW
jgi:hypothetical protein